MLNTPCILFAGGKSSRMGEDKALLPFGKYSTLAEYQYTKLSKIFQNVYISTKNPHKFNFLANFIIDLPSLQENYAPTIGFISAFEELSSDKIFVLSVDSPFVSENEIKKLIQKDSDLYDATIAKTKYGIQTMCGIYHRSLLPNFKIMQEENKHKLSNLLQNSKTQYLAFEDENIFLNLNNPHDYKEALLLLNS